MNTLIRRRIAVLAGLILAVGAAPVFAQEAGLVAQANTTLTAAGTDAAQVFTFVGAALLAVIAVVWVVRAIRSAK